MSYREYRPCPALEPWVECYWTKRVAGTPEAPGRTRVVPDGSADIIVDALAGEAVVVGTMLRPKLIGLERTVELCAVRFRPGGAQPFLGLQMREITDATVPLEPEGPLPRRLAEQVAEARPGRDAVAALEAALLHRRHEVSAPDPLVAAAAGRIAAAGGNVVVGDLAAELGTGERRLGRAFDRHVGISPKQLARVVRVQRAMRRLGRARGLEVAAATGFFDQAHLIHEFKALTGVTPGAWARA